MKLGRCFLLGAILWISACNTGSATQIQERKSAPETTLPSPFASPLASPKALPSPRPSLSPSPVPSPTLRSLPARLFGVTLDGVTPLGDIQAALQALAQMPIARIVFDENVSASYYRTAVTALRPVSYLMGEILDSYYVKDITVSGYLNRTSEYLAAFGNEVDLWEIGNEINGEWLGTTASVVQKMTGAFDAVHGAGKRTALTLYYNQDCWSDASHEMFTWAQANVPDRMKQGLDDVLVSFYEDDCNGIQPDWESVFRRLGALFPNSKLGFGEIGTSLEAKKASLIDRFYGLSLSAPRFIGGYFWWTFRQDMVPRTQPLWSALDTATR